MRGHRRQRAQSLHPIPWAISRSDRGGAPPSWERACPVSGLVPGLPHTRLAAQRVLAQLPCNHSCQSTAEHATPSCMRDYRPPCDGTTRALPCTASNECGLCYAAGLPRGSVSWQLHGDRSRLLVCRADAAARPMARLSRTEGRSPRVRQTTAVPADHVHTEGTIWACTAGAPRPQGPTFPSCLALGRLDLALAPGAARVLEAACEAGFQVVLVAQQIQAPPDVLRVRRWADCSALASSMQSSSVPFDTPRHNVTSRMRCMQSHQLPSRVLPMRHTCGSS